MDTPSFEIRWDKTQWTGVIGTSHHQACAIVRPGEVDRGMPLASVIRRRKTRRSKWEVSVGLNAYRSIGSVQEIREYITASSPSLRESSGPSRQSNRR